MDSMYVRFGGMRNTKTWIKSIGGPNWQNQIECKRINQDEIEKIILQFSLFESDIGICHSNKGVIFLW